MKLRDYCPMSCDHALLPFDRQVSLTRRSAA
jgi:hypothetical protein